MILLTSKSLNCINVSPVSSKEKMYPVSLSDLLNKSPLITFYALRMFDAS
ncbi:hypothetical protein PEC106568_29950 [Pectobacterium carotovorum subsp. carotovorum]|nr:hypothetical protein PEC106568_29950 [Pectobacterium carotovorum subsp. carotovorum]